MLNKLALSALILVAFVFSASVAVNAQKSFTKEATPVEILPAPEAAAASLEQCRNGSTAPGVGCVNSANGQGWVTGNAGFQNSHWAEDQFLTYRMLFSGLSLGTHTVIIGYDVLKGSVHAIDYLGTYNATETNNNPCFGVSGCSFAPGDVSTIAVPVDNVTVTNFTNPNTGLPIDQIPGVVTMWGGTLNSIAYVPYGGGEERQVVITFTATVANPVMAWGGHVAWQGDWGAGNSAGGISGSPYHMRLIDLDGSGGNQDRSLSADAVIPSGGVLIIKKVETADNQDASAQSFSFTASRSFTPLTFGLVDNNVIGPDRKQSDGITSFGPLNPLTVTEAVTPGFDLLDISCTESKTANSIYNLGQRKVDVVVDLNELVTCTFTNGLLIPSAAPVSITGRVTDSYGRGIFGARISLFNASSGAAYSATTNSFGYYRINDLPVGDFYVMSVAHKRYLFLNGSTSFSLEDNLTGMDFVADN